MYDKDKLIAECIEVVKKEKLTFFTDLAEFIEASLSTLYNLELEKVEDIKREIAKHRIAAKRKMRGNWVDSTNAALQISLYKLMADEQELAALTMSKVENTGNMTLVWKEEKTYAVKPETNDSPGLSSGSDN